MKVCTFALKSSSNDDVSESEAIGIAMAKKLGRMGPIQMIYTESLINTVLCKGLLKTLMDNTDLCDGKCSLVT